MTNQSTTETTSSTESSATKPGSDSREGAVRRLDCCWPNWLKEDLERLLLIIRDLRGLVRIDDQDDHALAETLIRDADKHFADAMEAVLRIEQDGGLRETSYESTARRIAALEALHPNRAA